MWFWIFMFICNLLIPLVMVFGGWMMWKHPPKEINGIYGYRTSMSGKNQQTWNFAHDYCGRLWWKIGWIMLLPSILIQLPFIGKNDDIVGMSGGILCAVQVAVLLFSIWPVERALRKKFDSNGKER